MCPTSIKELGFEFCEKLVLKGVGSFYNFISNTFLGLILNDLSQDVSVCFGSYRSQKGSGVSALSGREAF